MEATTESDGWIEPLEVRRQGRAGGDRRAVRAVVGEPGAAKIDQEARRRRRAAPTRSDHCGRSGVDTTELSDRAAWRLRLSVANQMPHSTYTDRKQALGTDRVLPG